jgi:hypothetical protein
MEYMDNNSESGQALLELEPPSGRVFSHALLGGRMVSHPYREPMMLSCLLYHKSTRLVANANRPEGISVFLESPYHTTKTTQTLYPQLYKTRHRIFIHPVDHLVDWQANLSVRLSIKCLLVAR